MQIVVRRMDNGIWTASFGSDGTFDNNWSRLPGMEPSTCAFAWNPVTNELHVLVRGGEDSIWSGIVDWKGVFNGWTPIPGAILRPYPYLE